MATWRADANQGGGLAAISAGSLGDGANQPARFSGASRAAELAARRLGPLLDEYYLRLRRLLSRLPSDYSAPAIAAWVEQLRPGLWGLLAPFWQAAIGIRFQDEDIIPLPIQEWWKESMEQLITGSAKRLSDKVHSTLIKAVQAGESERAIGQRLRTILEGYRDWELFRIARTEALRAYNLANLYHSASIPEVVGWRYETILDDRTSAICRPLAGKIVTRRTLTHVPPLHPHCRTILVPLYAEDVEGELPDVPVEVMARAQPIPEMLWQIVRGG